MLPRRVTCRRSLPSLAIVKICALPLRVDMNASDLEETQAQIRTLHQVFEALGKEPDESPCLPIDGIEKEGQTKLKLVEDELKDAVILAGCAETEHHEIAVYETLIAHADAMGHDDWHPAAMVSATGLREASYTDYCGAPQEFVSAPDLAAQLKKIDPKAQVQWDGRVLRIEANGQKFSLFQTGGDMVVNGTPE